MLDELTMNFMGMLGKNTRLTHVTRKFSDGSGGYAIAAAREASLLCRGSGWQPGFQFGTGCFEHNLAVPSVMPAEGPSLGTAPAGICTWTPAE